MFEVVMIACNIAGQCIGIEDNLGFYDAAEDCKARIEELVAVLDEIPIWPIPYAIEAGCREIKPEGVAV